MTALERLSRLRDDIRQFRELMSANIMQMSDVKRDIPKLQRSEIMKVDFSSDDEPTGSPQKACNGNRTIRIEDLETEYVEKTDLQKSDIFTKTIEILSSSDDDEIAFIPPEAEVLEKPSAFSKMHISSDDNEPTETIVFDTTKKILIESDSSELIPEVTNKIHLSDDDVEESKLLEMYL